MINMNEIEEEIKRLEECDCTTYSICEKLAILYIVRAHYKGQPAEEMRSSASMMSTPLPMMNGR